MKNKYKNIVWDWNGTLLDDLNISHQTINRMLEKRGLHTITVEHYRDIFAFPVKAYYESLGFDFSRDDWDEVSVDFVDTYNSLAGGVSLSDGVLDVLDGIRQAGLNQYILSALQEDTLKDMVSGFGIRNRFREVCGSNNIYADGKVQRGLEMLSRCPIEPCETLMIGDTLHDAEVAETLGFDCILYAGGHNSEWRLKEKGKVIRRMPDLLEL